MSEPQVVTEAVQQNLGPSATVLVADDSKSVRMAIRHLLANTSIEVVGEACNFAETIQLADRFRPSVIVMDIHMPDDKVVPAEKVRLHLSGSRLLAISLRQDADTQRLAEKFGAAMLLDKVNLSATLVPTVLRLCQSA